MRRALDEARMNADVVLLDSPPLLTSSDATLLVPRADSVLLVARAGGTSVEQATRTSDLIKRLRAPATGVVINCSKDGVGSKDHSRIASVIISVKDQIRGFPHLVRHRKSD
jgi:Mrp family chromosome partitioning ATPase